MSQAVDAVIETATRLRVESALPRRKYSVFWYEPEDETHSSGKTASRTELDIPALFSWLVPQLASDSRYKQFQAEVKRFVEEYGKFVVGWFKPESEGVANIALHRYFAVIRELVNNPEEVLSTIRLSVNEISADRSGSGNLNRGISGIAA